MEDLLQVTRERDPLWGPSRFSEYGFKSLSNKTNLIPDTYYKEGRTL
jgi:hypothetical protein